MLTVNAFLADLILNSILQLHQGQHQCNLNYTYIKFEDIRKH